MHSLIYAKLVEVLGLDLASKQSYYSGRAVRCDELYTNSFVKIDDHEFLAYQYKFGLTDFDVILGID